MFLQPDLDEINNHLILLEFRSLSDHALLTVIISIIKKSIQNKQQTIVRNSEEEEKFVAELMNIIRNIDTTNISNKELLKEIAQEYTRILDLIWYKFCKNINITKHFEAWWNKKYDAKLNKY